MAAKRSDKPLAKYLRDRISAINAGIERGLTDMRAGRVFDFDQAAVDRIKSRGRARLAAMRAGVKRGLADVKAGRTVPIEDVTIESIRQQAKKRASRSTPKKPRTR